MHWASSHPKRGGGREAFLCFVYWIWNSADLLDRGYNSRKTKKLGWANFPPYAMLSHTHDMEWGGPRSSKPSGSVGQVAFCLLFFILHQLFIVIVELFFLASEGGASRLSEIETFFFLFSFVCLDVVFLYLCRSQQMNGGLC